MTSSALAPRALTPRPASKPSRSLRQSGRHLLLGVAATLLVVACGGASGTVQPTTPFTEDDVLLFDRGISYITDPGTLGGGWENNWEEMLQNRVQRSDAIAVMTGHTYREDLTPSRQLTYRVTMTRDNNLYGELPAELVLIARPGDAGFESVEGNEARILEQDFVAFVKWQESPTSGEVEAAFHLEPASETVVTRVTQLIEQMHGVTNGSRTTVHFN